MVNPRYIETMIATAIADRDIANSEGFKLMILDRKIQCLPRTSCNPESFFICNIQDLQIREGFSSGEWRTITNKTIKTMKENIS